MRTNMVGTITALSMRCFSMRASVSSGSNLVCRTITSAVVMA
jgi:hypothetical protein